MPRMTANRPKRGSTRLLMCEPAITPQAQRPKTSPKPAGDRPKPWMKTGELPPSQANREKLPAPAMTA